jgi:tRNA(Ile)-lysidine synthase
MTGHKKVKDLFIEKKIPLPIRRNLPILVAGEEILWIPRYGRSELAKAGPKAREILKVRIVPLDG